jgi:hypothetical protein
VQTHFVRNAMKTLDQVRDSYCFALFGTFALFVTGACTASDSIGTPGDGSQGGILVTGGLSGTGGAAGGGGSGGAKLDGPVSADGPRPTDAPADGDQCPSGRIVYQGPGCGAEAVPVCEAQVSDAAMRITNYCACDGVTTLTADASGSHEPFLYAGVCRQDGGQTDGDTADTQPIFCTWRDGRRIQAGAAFVDGCTCCVCRSSGEPVCHAIGCANDAGFDTRPCESDSDCDPLGNSICVFDQGCDSPRGTCRVPGAGACPLFMVEDMAPFEYCGCDGVTYPALVGNTNPPRESPYKPYRHYGACTDADRGLDGGIALSAAAGPAGGPAL